MAIIRRASGLRGLFRSLYPTAHDGTYVKSTTNAGAGYYPYLATDPAKSLDGSSSGTSWSSGSSGATNQRFHIDLGAPKLISRLYYENYHNTGSDTDEGGKNFTLQGSNNAAAFAELTYATDTNWTEITTGQFAQHAAANSADPKYITVPATGSYRYFAIKIADNWGDASYMGIRRIELQEMY